jgi:hypothetical protein
MSRRNERKDSVSEKKVWKKSEGITQRRTKLHDEELHNLYSAPILLE